MTVERFAEIEEAIRDNMQSDEMLGELVAYTRAQQIIIESQRETITALQKG